MSASGDCCAAWASSTALSSPAEKSTAMPERIPDDGSPPNSLPIVGCERRRRLPHADVDDVNAEFASFVKNQSRDPLDGWVALEQIHRPSEILKRAYERVVLSKNHLVIEFAIDPSLHR